MAGKETKEHFPHIYRLFGHVLLVSHHHRADVRYLDFYGNSGQLATQFPVVRSLCKMVDRPVAIRADVGHVYCAIHLYA